MYTENKTTQIKPLKPSIITLNQSDIQAITMRLGKVAILKGILLSEYQLSVWIDEIRHDLEKGSISVDGVIKALQEFPREKSYGNLDYYSFFELAKVKSHRILQDIADTKAMLEARRTKVADPMPESLKELLKTHGATGGEL